MRSRLVLFAAALAVTGATPASEAIVDANRQAFVGAGGQKLQYAEEVGGTDVDYEIGKQAAVTVGASRQGSILGAPALYLQAQYWFARGKTAYMGFLQNLQTGAMLPWDSSTEDETSDWHLRVGKGFGEPRDRGMLTPFVEVGERRWVRNSSQTDAPYGYLEVYKHRSAEVGVLGQIGISSCLVGALEITAGSTFGAEVGAPALGLSSALKSETILGGAISFDCAVSSRLHAKLEHRDTNFRYGKSATVDGLFEPDSSTVQSTAMLTLGYGF